MMNNVDFGGQVTIPCETPSQLGTGKAVICPTDDPEMMGCGAVVTGPPDWEGFYDCPNCGLFFKSPA
jgi:hypothetical protein